MHGILALMNTKEDCIKASLEAMLASTFNAMTITEVIYLLYGMCRGVNLTASRTLQAVAVLHSVLTRGVDSGLLSISGCLIQALHVPIIPLDKLCLFFKSEQVRVFKCG